MFGGIRLGGLAGISLRVHPSWFVAFGWVTYSLSTGYLCTAVPGLERWVYWAMGGTAGLLFFASLLVHELAHSLVSRAYGIPVLSITLHLFGAVARLGREVERPREELWIALAGPAVSATLAVVGWMVQLSSIHRLPCSPPLCRSWHP